MFVHLHNDGRGYFQSERMKKTNPNCLTCNSRSGSIFCHLADDTLEGLDKHKLTKHLPRGSIIYQEGKQAEGLYCVRTGKVKLFKSGKEGKEVILGIAKSGDILGFRSALMNEPHTRNAEVIEDSQICFVDKNFFVELVQKNPDVAFDVIRQMGKELEATEFRISDFLNTDVRTRFVRLLLMLQKSYGVEDATGILLNVRLTRQEMGEMIGAASETVIRILSDLDNQKLISMDGKKIKITNLQGLVEEANIEI